MGLTPPHIYLDSCIVIYLVEEHPTFAPIIEQKLAYAPDIILCVSDLSEMECLVMPLRVGNQLLLDKFQKWFAKAKFLPLEKQVFQRATQLRADFKSVKTPAAIHLATALQHGCDEFWTNDNRLAPSPHKSRKTF